MSVVLDLQRAALVYIDRTGQLEDIKAKCEFYTNVQDKAFEFLLTLDPVDLLDSDASLGMLLLNQTASARKVFQEVVFMTISALKLLPKCTTPSQVVVTLKLTALPAVDEYQLGSSKDIVTFLGRSFLLYRGVVCGMSTITKYTKLARFVCTLPDCPGSEGDKYIRLHTPGATETQTIRSDFTCAICSCPLEEDVTCRVLADKLVVELLDEEAYSHQQFGQRHQSLLAYLRDDLVHDVEIGQTISIIGRPVLDLHQKLLILEANSLAATERKEKDDPESYRKPPEAHLLPENIKNLYEDRKHSPWSFGLSLAYAFAGHITPPGSFIHLKLGLLLSLASSPVMTGRALDVLAVGSDSLILQRLLDYAATFSDRHVTHTVSSPLTVSVTRDRHGQDGGFIHGGSILLANSGVCIIHNLGSHKKQTKQELLQALDTNKILVEIPPKLSHQGVQQMFLSRRCSVWATLDPSTASQRQKLEDADLNSGKKSDIVQALADVFGMVYFADLPPDSYADCMQIQQTILRATGTSPVELISDSDFKKFLDSAKGRSVTFTEASEYLIRGYYVASRRARASIVNLWTLPISAIKAVTSLAESHAKLSLRSEVTEYDAVMAILLYEECVTTRSGQSVLGVRQMTHIKDNNLQNYIGQERDKELHHFHRQIKHFIKVYAADIDLDVVLEE